MRRRTAALLTILGLLGTVSEARAQESRPLGMEERPLANVLATLPSAAFNSSAPPSTAAGSELSGAGSTVQTVAVALYASMILDTKSTFDSNAWCPRCVEANPFAAPFVKAGPAATYTAGVAFDTGILYLSSKMKRSSHPVLRRIWFIGPVGLAAGHLIAARHNYALRDYCARSTSTGCR